MKFKEWCRKLYDSAKQYVKDPVFILSFIITWLLLESPAIFGGVMYIITNNYYWWSITLSWIALTAPALPIPVIPISMAVAIAATKIKNKIKNRGK